MPVTSHPALSPAGRYFPAVLGRRQRIITGVFGIGLGFGAPFILSVVLVATSGDPSLLILPLPFLGGLWAIQGLAPESTDGLALPRHHQHPRSRLAPDHGRSRGHFPEPAR